MTTIVNPSYSQTTMLQAVNTLLGKDKNKPEVVYEFTGKDFVEPVNYNPYTGASS